MIRLVRLARAFAHLAVAAWKLAVHAPLWSGRTQRRQVARWSRKVFRIFGVKLLLTGTARQDTARPMLIVANHVSWLDIYALLAAIDVRFVAKSEVRGWPIVGRLAVRLGTLFIERGRRAASRETSQDIAALLARGTPVCVFAEGTTTDGRHLEPFRAPLFEPAVTEAALVQPVAIRYVDARGELSNVPAFVADMSLQESLWRLAGAGGVTAEVHFLAPIEPQGRDRRTLAVLAERAIASHLGVPVLTRPRAEPREAGSGAIAFDLAAR